MQTPAAACSGSVAADGIISTHRGNVTPLHRHGTCAGATSTALFAGVVVTAAHAVEHTHKVLDATTWRQAGGLCDRRQ